MADPAVRGRPRLAHAAKGLAVIPTFFARHSPRITWAQPPRRHTPYEPQVPLHQSLPYDESTLGVSALLMAACAGKLVGGKGGLRVAARAGQRQRNQQGDRRLRGVDMRTPTSVAKPVPERRPRAASTRAPPSRRATPPRTTYPDPRSCCLLDGSSDCIAPIPVPFPPSPFCGYSWPARPVSARGIRLPVLCCFHRGRLDRVLGFRGRRRGVAPAVELGFGDASVGIVSGKTRGQALATTRARIPATKWTAESSPRTRGGTSSSARTAGAASPRVPARCVRQARRVLSANAPRFNLARSPPRRRRLPSCAVAPRASRARRAPPASAIPPRLLPPRSAGRAPRVGRFLPGSRTSAATKGRSGGHRVLSRKASRRPPSLCRYSPS